MEGEKPNLSNYTEQELFAEIRRRRIKPFTELDKKKNSDWYYMVGEPPDIGLPPDFWIVHKREWHFEHSIGDSHISRFLTLPEGFVESMESTFEYHGKTKKGCKSLEEYNFTKLENPIRGYDAMVIHAPFGERIMTPSLDIICDTKDIMALVEKKVNDIDTRIKKKKFTWSKENYLKEIEDLTKPNNLYSELTSDYTYKGKKWGGGIISVMERKVYESLPECPEGLFDGG